jgi:hypothetical protein
MNTQHILSWEYIGATFEAGDRQKLQVLERDKVLMFRYVFLYSCPHAVTFLCILLSIRGHQTYFCIAFNLFTTTESPQYGDE